MFSKTDLVRVAGACVSSPVLSGLLSPFYRRRASIIYYHAVWRPRSAALSLFGGIDVDRFREDMTILARHFKPVSLDNVLRFNAEEASTDEALVAVTFDDGCDLTRCGAADVLDEMGIPATTFVVSSCVGNRHLMWQHKFSAIHHLRGEDLFVREFNRLAETITPGSSIGRAAEQTARTCDWPMSRKDEYADALWKACDMPPCDELLEEHRPYASWDELAEWQRRGHQVGLHTRTHPFCSRLSSTEIEAEIIKPARDLCDRLDLSSVPFAYPFGNRLPRTTEQELSASDRLTCLLGIDGLSTRGTPPCDLERARAESGLDDSLFVRPLVRALRGR